MGGMTLDDLAPIKTAEDGSYYFVVKAANGETLATSEMYTTRTSAVGGRYSVLVNVLDYMTGKALEDA